MNKHFTSGVLAATLFMTMLCGCGNNENTNTNSLQTGQNQPTENTQVSQTVSAGDVETPSTSTPEIYDGRYYIHASNYGIITADDISAWQTQYASYIEKNYPDGVPMSKIYYGRKDAGENEPPFRFISIRDDVLDSSNTGSFVEEDITLDDLWWDAVDMTTADGEITFGNIVSVLPSGALAFCLDEACSGSFSTEVGTVGKELRWKWQPEGSPYVYTCSLSYESLESAERRAKESTQKRWRGSRRDTLAKCATNGTLEYLDTLCGITCSVPVSEQNEDNYIALYTMGSTRAEELRGMHTKAMIYVGDEMYYEVHFYCYLTEECATTCDFDKLGADMRDSMLDFCSGVKIDTSRAAEFLWER